MDRAFRGYWVVLVATLSACQAAEPALQKESAAIEKAVVASEQAARKGGWDAFAALIHSESLQDFKSLFVPVLQAAAKKGGDEQADLLTLFDEAIEQLGPTGRASAGATAKDVAEPEKPQPAKIKELIVGKWEDPRRPGNWWEFDRDGDFTASIRAGVIKSNIKGTYRILPDGSLEMTIKVLGQTSEPVMFKVRVTKERLTFVDEEGKEESYQRAK